MFLMVVLAIFLCPSTSSRASCHYYDGLRSVKDIKSYDWCAAVADCLNTGLSKFKSFRNKKSLTLSGCLFVLYTAFFDFLGLDAGIVPQTTPCIGVWTDDNVDKYLAKYPLCDKIEERTLPSHVHARNESAAFQQNLGGSSSQHNTPKKMKKIVEDHSSPLLAATVPVSKDSVLAAFPG